MIRNGNLRRVAAALLVLAAACSRAAAGSTLESALPVAPGEPWEAARAALAKLDPSVHEAGTPGTRAAMARTDLLVAGVHFGELTIAGMTDRPGVRSVALSARPPAGGCDRIRAELLKALGPAWDEGATHLGATTATRGTRVARIVCNGAELSITIAG